MASTSPSLSLSLSPSSNLRLLTLSAALAEKRSQASADINAALRKFFVRALDRERSQHLSHPAPRRCLVVNVSLCAHVGENKTTE